MESIECYATEKSFGTSLGIITLQVHDKANCTGEFCVIHNPSDHPLRDAPLNWRADRYPPFFERICECGVGHPDPDSITWLKVSGKGHGADIHGCCSKQCCAEPINPDMLFTPLKKCTKTNCGNKVRYSELTDDANTHWHRHGSPAPECNCLHGQRDLSFGPASDMGSILATGCPVHDQPPATTEPATVKPVRIKIGLKTYQHGPYDLWYLVGDDGEVSTVGLPDYALIPAYVTSPAATVKPSVDKMTLIARDVHLYDGGENAAITGSHALRIAEAIHALIPGRTEAEVREETIAYFEDLYFGGSSETRTWVAARVREHFGLPPRELKKEG